MATPCSAPDAVAMTAASGGVVAAVPIAPRTQVVVATSPVEGQQLSLSPAAGDHVATVARPQKVNVAALRSPDVVATNTASARGGRAQPAARQQGESSEPHIGSIAAEATVTMGIFTTRKRTKGTSVMRTSASAKRAAGASAGREAKHCHRRGRQRQ